MAASVQIPGVQIEGELGRGTYSIVYRGRWGTTACAIKLARLKGRWTRWFYREAVSLARVRHPGLPRVYEVGEIQDLPYLVLELVEGETLAERLRRGRMSEREIIDLATNLASTLASVHAVNLVHRDVKPRNIIVDRGHVRLVDFGFATPIEGLSAASGSGTPRYAAPEQMRAPYRTDARTDLYALGRVLAECFLGIGASADDPERPDIAKDLLAVGASAAFARVVSALVEPDPDDRYPDAGALQADLARVLDAGWPRGPAAYEPARQASRVVGREAELERVQRAWNGLRPDGGGTFVLFQGKAGSGKTRLLRACAATASGRDGRVVEVRCAEGDAPLTAVRRILEGCQSSIRRLGPSERLAAEEGVREAASGHLGSFARLIAPKLDDILGPGAPMAAVPDAFPEGVADLLVRLAAALQPLVICLDDVQWMDPVSRDILVCLTQRVADAPLLVIAASRTETADPIARRIEAVEPARAVTIDLAPLDRDQISQIILDHLGTADLEPNALHRVAALAGDTPLEIIEVLGAFLDSGAIRPHAASWRLDVDRADRIALPKGSRALLGRRLRELPPATARVLDAASVLGSTFEERLLADVVGIDTSDLAFAIADAQRAGLVENSAPGACRFVHDSLREMILVRTPESERRDVHQAAAEALEARADGSVESLYAIAAHYVAGHVERSSGRVVAAARAAADAALKSYDNETALRFLQGARAAALAGALALDHSFDRSVGEAEVRLGNLQQSLRAFESAHRSAPDRHERARILGRIAWVHQVDADPERAWQALDRAFRELGERMPTESASSAANTAFQLARAQIASRTKWRGAPTADEIEARAVLCGLHYQNARLGLEYAKPLRMIQSTLDAKALSEPLPPSPVVARALVWSGFVSTAAGRRAAGSAELERALSMAKAIDDQATVAFCVQVQSIAACFAGDMELALRLLTQAVEQHGAWLELNEYCQLATTADIIESTRGRAVESWRWIGYALNRLRRSPHEPNAPTRYFVHRARAAAATLGRSIADDRWLASHVATLDAPAPRGAGLHHLLTWAPRARYLLDTGELGAPFDELVRAFDAEKHNPRTIHPTMAEYYIAVAHGRVNQCLRVRGDERRRRLPPLEKALADLRVVAKLPVFKSHRVLIDGYLAWFEGKPKEARSHFAEAQSLADQEVCPWVLHGIARAHAHVLRDEGKVDAARDHARIAELLARDHGAEPRARVVRQEFGLPEPVVAGAASSHSSGSRESRQARRQLTSLLDVMRAPHPDLRPDQQALAILDDLMRNIAADRGFLWFQPASLTPNRLIVTRPNGDASVQIEGWREAVMRRVLDKGLPWPDRSPDASRSSTHLLPTPTPDDKRVVAAPLSLHDQLVGVVCVERDAASAPFSIEERDLLVVLSHQVPIALELGRLLAERGQLQASLQQAQKMEAVGQLAGGVAHDFNNMLMAIQASLHMLGLKAGLERDVTDELGVISDAAKRAAQLTRQLLSFSRHRPLPRSSVDVNRAIGDLGPMLKRLVGERIVIELCLDSTLPNVLVDRASFDQAIVNLVVNSRDAIAENGRIQIVTNVVTLDETAARRGAPSTGEFIEIEVTDDGQGMNADSLARVFDPFFTTKSSKSGTGLGLTVVYGFVKNAGGHIEVTSKPSEGTTFRFYLPKSQEASPKRVSSMLPAPPPSTTSETILVVDDDPLVLGSVRRVLQKAGYRVHVADGAITALEIVARERQHLALIILDVLMPDMTGPELGRRITDMQIPAKLLFMSGYAPQSLPGIDAQIVREMLQKPIAGTDLLASVRRILDSTDTAS